MKNFYSANTIRIKTLALKYIVALILCSTIANTGISQELLPFKAIYKIGIPNITAAEMTVIVKRADNKLLYQSKVAPAGLIGHLLNIRAQSYSEIIKRGKHWLPLVYEKEVADKKKKQLYRFDWNNYKARVLYKKKEYDLAISKNTLDENTFQLKLRDDVINSLGTDFKRNYTLLSDGRLKQRRFVKQSNQTIKTELGEFNSIRIVRYKNEIADQIYWLSPEHNYLPLKIVKLDGEKINTTMTLTDLVFTQ